MRPGSHYLDFTGSGLYTNSQLAAAARELGSVVMGNPHSTNPSSMLSTAELQRARERVLQWLSADPEEYAVVFVRWAARVHVHVHLHVHVCGCVRACVCVCVCARAHVHVSMRVGDKECVRHKHATRGRLS